MENDHTQDVVVIGAGPAGIAAIVNLLDLGFTKITWVDPFFDVGGL